MFIYLFYWIHIEQHATLVCHVVWNLCHHSGGCASDYLPKADLSSYHSTGVIVPGDSSEPHGAGDFLQLNNRTVGEDRLKNAAVGAGDLPDFAF